jgi:hypothetical protein
MVDDAEEDRDDEEQPQPAGTSDGATRVARVAYG